MVVFTQVNDRWKNIGFSLVALTSLLFFEFQRNCFFCANGLLSLTQGDHITSHPMDIEIKTYQIWQKLCKTRKRIKSLNVLVKIAYLQKLQKYIYIKHCQEILHCLYITKK